jgi:ligand-binding sensor domain-containing protein
MFLLSVLLGLGGSVFIRSLMAPAISPLERLIAANEPAESALSLAFAPDGTTLVGTSLGLLAGDGKTWSRTQELPVTALVSVDGPGLYLGGPNGLTHNGKTVFTTSAVTALAVDPGNPQRLLAATAEGLRHSQNGGQTWDKLGAPPGQQPLALAIAPLTGRLLAGTIDGTLWYSDDDGQTWTTLAAPGGSITSALYDPFRSGRLWIAAGGRVLYSDDGGNAWQSARLAVKNRPVVALAISPAEGHDLWGITADGLLQPVTQP